MKEMVIVGEWTDIPSDNKIFGNFIESGFGRQVNGMWSEMLYNRAFRKVPEYNRPTWEWLGIDRENYNEKAPFWHSGYEEYNWSLIGEPDVNYSCGTHTYKGLTSYMLHNMQEGHICGVLQKGIHLQKGRKYHFLLLAGVRGDTERAGLNGFGDTIQSDKIQELKVKIGNDETNFELTTMSKHYEWEWVASENEVVDISLTFTFEGTLLLSCASLMPADNMGGWRVDVVEKIKEAAPSVVRFPGGCFVSFYNWESSIGDRDAREPQPSFYWGGLEENDVGLDEFLHLAKLVGFEPQICFNMMTSTPFKARQMVEYLNAPADTGMGRLRMLNGNTEPYSVKLFEMDNEPGRKWTARQYAEECVAFAREMRLADPSLQFMLAAYAYDLELLPLLLEIAGKDINYVIYREGSPEFVEKVFPVLREYNKRNGAKLKLVNTEWLPSCHSMEPFEDSLIPVDFKWHGEITNDYRNIFATQQISWNYALNGAHRLLDYISYGGEFALANFNNMCNTWGQNIIEATKDESYLSCMGQVFAMFAKIFEPCISAKVNTGDDRLFALAVKAVGGKKKLYVINHSSKDIKAILPEGNWHCLTGIKGKERMAHETNDKRCVFGCEAAIEGRTGEFPALSFVCLEA